MADKTKGSKTTIKQGTATKPADYTPKSYGVAHQHPHPPQFEVNGPGGLTGKDAKGLSTLTGGNKKK
jgi:hypothetical protein